MIYSVKEWIKLSPTKSAIEIVGVNETFASLLVGDKIIGGSGRSPPPTVLFFTV
jgi:hypothetical protein